jgi:hypothetical protein
MYWYTANIANKSVFNALSIVGGLEKAGLCDKWEDIFYRDNTSNSKNKVRPTSDFPRLSIA